MTQLNDEIKRATVTPPTVNDGMTRFFNVPLVTKTGCLQDAERAFLLEQPAVTVAASLNDMWFQFLSAVPHSLPGALNDKKKAYWLSVIP